MTFKRPRPWLAPIGLVLVLLAVLLAVSLAVLLGRILLPIWQHTSARDAALRLVETAPGVSGDEVRAKTTAHYD